MPDADRCSSLRSDVVCPFLFLSPSPPPPPHLRFAAAGIGNRHVAHGGDDYTVNVGHYDYNDAAMRQHHGPSYRQIVDFSDLDGSLFLNPLGQYGLELSEHYDDLVEKWSDGGYMPMVTAVEDYRGSIYHTDTVKPA